MGWMEQLYRTYQRCQGLDRPPPPIAHAVQQAHLQITIDGAGHFCGARVLDKEETVIPATEDSANRTSKPTAHPLADKIIYCAGDYSAHGGEKASYFDLYLRQLRDWAGSSHSHPKVRAVLAYVERGTLVADLIRVGVMPVGEDGRLAVEWPDAQTMPDLLRQLTPKADGDRKVREVGDALVRWRVELPDADNADTWGDPELSAAWIAYYASTQSRLGLCMVEGRELPLAEKHPGRLRNGADKAKLISSNDGAGFTYRGRFTDADQAAAIGFEVSQKAHNALRWLIERQGTRLGDQAVVVAWTTGSNPGAGNLCDEFDNDCPYGAPFPEDDDPDPVGDVGQNQSRQLGRAARGGAAEIDPSDDVMVMVLDAATPGRMSVRYYRELKGSEFLANIAAWRKSLRWRQAGGTELRNGKRVLRRFDGSPSLKSIAEAAYGPNADDKLIQATVMRLLPCIVEGRPPPEDLGRAAFHRACRRIGLRGEWEFEKVLGIACALHQANHPTEEYQMALEDRKSRDYLFGRLLAIAERIEVSALEIAKEKRDTKAAKYLQHFANRPASTWMTIVKELGPYRSRLGANAPRLLHWLESRQAAVMHDLEAIRPDAFKDQALGPEFLLGYDCQRHAFFTGTAGADQAESESTETVD